MKVELSGKRHTFVSSVIGLAILAAPSAASSQQEAQGQGQRQGDVQVAVAPGEAQQSQQPMTWNEVRVIKVKSDRVGEFEGLLKEFATVMREQDGPGFNVWQVAFGAQNTYHIASQVQSIAAMADLAENPPMEPMEWANWVNRIESTIDSHVLSLAQIHPDLSIMPQGQGQAQGQGQGQAQGQGQGQGQAQGQGQGQGQARPQTSPPSQAGTEAPELLILVSQTLLPGKRQEYETWLRNEMLPALRQSDIQGIVTNEMAFGSEDRTWVFAVPVESWATLDEPMPLYRSMGRQAAQELLARGDSLIDRSETIVLRTRPDLATAGGQTGQQQVGRQ